MIESGAGVDAGTPPVLAGDELIRFTVASKPAWRTSRTVKLVDGGRVLAVTSCSLSMKLSATTKATFIGPAPCDGLVADAAALPGAVTQPQG